MTWRSRVPDRNSSLQKEQIRCFPLCVVPMLSVIVLVWLDIPSYLYTVNPALIPKYFYLYFVLVCLPWICRCLEGRTAHYFLPFLIWASALILLESLHLWMALSEADPARAKIMQTDIQYAVLCALLGAALSAIKPRYYTFLFPLLSFTLSSLVIFDFLNPGALYSYDIQGAGAVPGRGAGTFINPNRAGEAIVITLLISVCFFSGRVLVFLLSICGIALLFTFSRSAIIAWLLIFGTALCTKKLPCNRYVVVAGVFCVVPVVLAMLSSYVQGSGELTVDASANILERLGFFRDFSLTDDSARERAALLRAGIQTFLEYPFWGAGGAYTFVWTYGASTHNQVVMLCAEYGIFGLALWVWLIIILWNGSYLGEKEYHLSFVIIFVYFSMFSHNLFDSLYSLLAFALISQKRNHPNTPVHSACTKSSG